MMEKKKILLVRARYESNEDEYFIEDVVSTNSEKLAKEITDDLNKLANLYREYYEELRLFSRAYHYEHHISRYASINEIHKYNLKYQLALYNKGLVNPIVGHKYREFLSFLEDEEFLRFVEFKYVEIEYWEVNNENNVQVSHNRRK